LGNAGFFDDTRVSLEIPADAKTRRVECQTAKGDEMQGLENIFSDAVLNTIDRVLVLHEKETLTDSEIKKLLHATRVVELKNTNSEDLDSLICQVIAQALLHKSLNIYADFKVYTVKGRAVNSLMLTLKVTPVATLLLNADRIKKLHNACFTKRKLDDLLFRVKQVQTLHDDMVVFYSRRKIETTLPIKTSQIKELFQDYAKEEMLAEMAVINDVMKNRW
jgi:uncharacterized protein YbcI